MKTIFTTLLYLVFSLRIESQIFTVPELIKDNMSFWKKVYSFYDSHQVVFYDQEDPTLIFAVIDLPKVKGEISAPKYKSQVQEKFDAIKNILKLLGEHKEPEKKTDDYNAIKNLLMRKKLLGKKGLDERLRMQSGLKSQFALGLKISGRYIEDMKAILKSQGLPTELVALVFVESLFFLSATSHAGASGPWGIMKETGQRLGIHVNNLVDERRDWQKATMAASRFLKTAYERLGEWPLAITAYNYGLPGMQRAVGSIQSKELADIILKHESPIFKFASKNYYAEFLAALEVILDEKKYFPHVVKDKPKKYDLLELSKPVLPSELYRVKAITLEELADLNPGLTKKTLKGEEAIPARFSLRIPSGRKKQFNDQLKKISPAKMLLAQNKISERYKTNGRESLAKIAQKFGISALFLVDKLKKPISYKPKGTMLIRSGSYLFTGLKEIEDLIKKALAPITVAKD